MNGPDALERANAARRESVVAIAAAILPVGASLDPQPVPGTLDRPRSPQPPAIR